MENIGLRTPSLIRQSAFIGGKWCSAFSNKTYSITNPSTNKVICEIPDMNEKETYTAIDVAHKAFQTWKKTTAQERSGILRKWYNLMLDHKEDISRIITLENGKPLVEARGEVAYGSSFFEWFAEEAKRIYGEIAQSPSSSKEFLFVRQPIGVAGLITPWNFPVAMITRKVGAALAAGCTCIIKPAEDTPLSALAMVALAEEAGVPEGVVNIITGSRQNAPNIGKALCESKKVAGISFTGSTAVGKLLYRDCSSTIKHIGLELGGNAPFIVFNSAKLSNAIKSLMIAKFRNSGQACISANRIFVQSGIYDEFVEELKKAITSSNKSRRRVDSIVKESVKAGANLVMGGKRHSLGGLFYEPTILENCSPDMRCFKEEIFGPVVAIKKFETEEEVLEMANACDVGLAGYIFTQNPAQIFRVSRELETGMVGVNEGLISAAEASFGGIKESGLGREGSRHGIDEFIDIKYICIGDLD
ncbi:Succinate-semialdehyde dehydrogenase, mitochondrial [Armadillidium vulgare]|nr:Succinate-semialdehyde dehydrogenase, mitochondrial [Armadillidium vulgare]